MINTDVHSVEPSYPNSGASTTIPSELISWDQWVAWKFGKKRSSGKRAKAPIDPRTGYPGDATDPETWRGHESALAYFGEHNLAGVGFSISEHDPFTGLDFDKCGNRSTGYVHPAVLEELDRLGNPYAEWSPSGNGIKAWVKAEKPGGRCKQTVTAWGGDFEMYDRGRFFTVTGNVFSAGPITEAQEAVDDLYHRYFPEPVGVERTTASPLPDPIDLTDAELLEKARTARFGREFAALFDAGDTSAHNNDPSRADYALMVQLAFWTGKDADRMERLFSLSAMGERDKWKSRPQYRRATIDRAIKKTSKVYEPEQHRPNKTRVRDRIRERMVHALFSHPWTEIAGRADAAATDFHGCKALLRLAWKANTEEVDVSIREYAEEAGIGNLATATKSLTRLHDLHRWVEKVRDGDHGNAARYRLRTVPKVKHIEIGGISITLNPPCGDNEYVSLLGSHLIRNTSPEMPEYDKNGRKIPRGTAPLVKSVGKAAAWVADVIHAAAPIFAPDPVPRRFVAGVTGIASNHLQERHVRKLVAAGLVEAVEGGYAVPEDVNAALKEELRVSGSLAAANCQRKRHDQQRRAQEIKRLAWMGHDGERIAAETGYDLSEIAAVLSPVDQAPTEAEMDAARFARSADGEYADLEREAEHFPEIYTADEDPQHPIGHDYPEATHEATEEPVTPSEPVQNGTVPPDYRNGSERPCEHSGLGHVYPGGNGCYMCDPDHPLRQHERERGVIDLDEYRRSRGVA